MILKINRLLEQLIKAIPLFLVMVASLCVNAQISDFNFTIENEVQTARNVLEFDLYVLDTNTNENFKLSTIQAGITVNPTIYNGGEITMKIVEGFSELTNATQHPRNVLWDQGRNVIQMTPPPIPDETTASVISQVAPGTRICRMRLTNTQPFTAYSKANLTFSFTSPYPYPTKIAQFIRPGENHSTEVTCNSGNSFRNTTDIELNTTPDAYEVTGLGSYCEGSTGLTVTLSNSQIGINYQLKRFENLGIAVPGTGAPLTWPDIPAGYYTVEAINAATLITNTMTGYAWITMNPSPAAFVLGNFRTCLGREFPLGRPSITGNTYSWSSIPAGLSSTDSNPLVTPVETTTYTLTETITATGCSTTNSNVITINPPPTLMITNPAAVCSPATVNLTAATVTQGSQLVDSYDYYTDADATLIYPTPYNATAGTYYIKGSSWWGCPAIKPVTVTVNPLPVITITTPATCDADLLHYSVVLTISSGTPGSTAGTLTQVGNTCTITKIPSGTNIIITLADTYCSKTLIINAPDCSCPVISSPVSGGDKGYCTGGALPAIAASVLTGETVDWYVTPTGGIAVATGTTSFTPSFAGTFYAETRNPTTNCKSSTRTEVKVTMNPLPAVSAGTDRAICLNAVTIMGTSPTSERTYSWTSLPVGYTSTSANIIVTPLVTTTYTVTETVTATGCSNMHSVVVTLNPLPAAFAGTGRTICSGSTTTLGATAVAGSTYNWSSLPAGFTSAEANPVANPSQTTTYTVVETITATGCTNTNSVLVTVNPLPAAIAGVDRGICPGSGTTLGATAVTGSTYTWSSLPAGLSSTSSDPSVNPAVNTTYTVTEIITATGCLNTNHVVVTINPLPAAAAGANRAICFNTATKLGAPAVAGSIYSWTQVPSGTLPTIAEPVVTPTVSTTYTLVETITATGCTNTNSVVVTVNPLTGAAGPITGYDSFTQGTTGVAYSVGAIANATSYIWKYTGTGVTINGTGTNVTLDFSLTASSGSLKVKGHNNCGDGMGSTLIIGDTKTLNLTSVMLEGLYAGGGTMNQAQDENGAHWPATVADHITVELHSATNYGTIVYTASDVPLSTDGKAKLIIPGAYNDSYYITVNHRNSIETTSATARSFIGSSITQSFGSPADVYGGNLRHKDVNYVVCGGDSNKDSVVDLGDMNDTEGDATTMLFGYFVTDVNGDGIVDMSDMNLIEVNATDMIMVVLP